MSQQIKRVVVIGAGGVGFWMTVALRRDYPNLEIIVYDDDNFIGGFGAQRLPYVANKKMKKVEFLNGFVRMAMRDPGLVVKPIKMASDIIEANFSDETLLVDCTDMSLDKRQPIWDAAIRSEVKYLRVSYDGNGIVVISHGLPFATNPGGNYAIVPTLAQSLWAGGVGAAAVEKLLKGETFSDYQMELK